MHEHDDVPDSEKFELTDWHLKLVLMSGIGLVVVTLLSFAAGYVIMQSFGARPSMSEFSKPAMADDDGKWTTETRLQTAPWDVLDEFRVDQAHTQGAYGLVSDAPEIYHIPVEEAMKIIAEMGLIKIDAVGAPAELPTESSEH